MRASDALDVLLAPRCAGCGAAGSWFCVRCRDASDPISRRLGALTLVAAGAHEGPLRDAIHRLKYGDEPGLAGELGALIAGRVAGDLARGVRLDCLVRSCSTRAAPGRAATTRPARSRPPPRR